MEMITLVVEDAQDNHKIVEAWLTPELAEQIAKKNGLLSKAQVGVYLQDGLTVYTSFRRYRRK